MKAKFYGFDRSFLHDTTEEDSWVIDMVRASEYVKLESDVSALQEQISRYSMSPGWADQRQNESKYVRVALGFGADAEDVAPCDLVDAITALKEQVRALAAENSALINSSVCPLQEGRPPYGFYASEWFIAKLKNGQYAALKALPEEYSHDYRTNDGTYFTKDWVVGWMQTPDTEYRPNVTTTATDASLREIRAQAVDDTGDRIRLVISEFPESSHDIVEECACIAGELAARIRSGEQP